MTTTRHYSSTDAGAPALTGEVGSLIALLKTCLVGTSGTAYGSTPAAGWTKEFEDAGAHKVVFRNSLAAGGTGCYIRILDDGSGTSATASAAHINAYSSMSDIDTGADETPAAVAGWPGGRIEKTQAASSTAQPWELISDEVTFYLVTNANSNLYSVIYGAGDFQSYVPLDSYRVFVAAGAATTAAASRGCKITEGVAVNNTTGGVRLMRNEVAASGSVSSGIYAYAAAGAAHGSDTAPFEYSANFAGETQMAEGLVTCATGIRGRLRGVYLPYQDTIGLSLPMTIAGADAGSSYRVVRGNTSWSTSNDNFWGAALIEKELSWPL